MATLRYYYSDTISMFLTRSTDEIVGKLTLASQHDINDETSNSWVEEIESLRNILAPYKDRGSIYFEYNIPRMGRRADVILVIDELDWHYIWQKQSLYPELAEELLKLAYVTHNFLMDQANGGIVRTISRTQAVWKNFQDYKYTLSDKFIDTLASMAENKAVAQSAKRAHKFNSDVDASVEVFKLGAQYWMKVYNDLVKETVLSYGDCSFIKGIADYITRGNLPSSSQCKRLLKIVAKAEDKGYIMPN